MHGWGSRNVSHVSRLGLLETWRWTHWANHTWRRAHHSLAWWRSHSLTSFHTLAWRLWTTSHAKRWPHARAHVLARLLWWSSCHSRRRSHKLTREWWSSSYSWLRNHTWRTSGHTWRWSHARRLSHTRRWSHALAGRNSHPGWASGHTWRWSTHHTRRWAHLSHTWRSSWHHHTRRRSHTWRWPLSWWRSSSKHLGIDCTFGREHLR